MGNKVIVGQNATLHNSSNNSSSSSIVLPPNSSSHLPNSTAALSLVGRQPQPTITVFYNFFVKNKADSERVQTIVSEQLSLLLPEEHHEVFYNSLGYPFSIPNATLIQNYPKGDESVTLYDLWEYCKSNNNHDTKVVYLHSKGSFHDNPENTMLRLFLTNGALSKECATLPDKCNVCSSRMSPFPHAHTSGNMWLARCDYVAQLVNPMQDPRRRKKKKGEWFPKRKKPYCDGYGRYFVEHWIHSHPTAMPCDLYPNPEFVWGYAGIPTTTEGDDNFEKNLQMAPRFELHQYIPGIWKTKCLPHTTVQERIAEYEFMYNERPDKSWWGWKTFNQTMILNNEY